MAVDVLGKMKDFWTSEAIQQLSVMLDEQPDRVEQALSLGAPTLLAGLLNASSGTTDARRLVDLVKQEPEEMSRFGGLSGLLSHVAGLGDVVGFDPIMKYGKTALRSIFGDKLDAVLELIATDTGAKPTTAAALMSLLAPTLMGMIRQETAARGLSGDTLHNFLMAQRDSIASLAPGKLADTLGVRSLADLGTASDPMRRPPASPAATSPGYAKGAPTPGSTLPDYAGKGRRGEPVATNPSPGWWAIPVALGILAVVGYYFLPQANPPGPETDGVRTADENRPAVDAAQSVGSTPAKTALTGADPISRAEVTSPSKTADGRPVLPTDARMVSMPLPDGASLEVPKGSYLEAAVKMLGDENAKDAKTLSAESLVFDQDSKLTVEAAHSARRLAEIAKAYPKAKLKIEAHETPGAPDDQKERHATAQKRADAVRDALVDAGLPAERVVAEVRASDDLDATTSTEKADISIVITPQ